MSKPAKTKVKVQSDFAESFKDVVKTNSNLLTIFAIAIIFLTGITLVNNPANWWIPALGIAILFLTIFVFMNARVVLKIATATVATILLSSAGFTVGGSLEPLGSGAFVWMFSIFFIYFGSLALSYMLPSGQSRWGTLIFAQTIAFILTYGLALNGVELLTSVLIGMISGLVAFVLFFLYGGSSRYSRKNMPENTLSEELAERILQAAEHAGFQGRVISKKDNKGSVILWKDHAYIIHPVEMTSGFMLTGKRKKRLTYNDKNINPWLIALTFKIVPHWKSRGADIMPVLLDLKSRNGKDAKTIGVAVPDTKRQMPLGVYPGKLLNSSDSAALNKAFLNLEPNFKDYLKPLTEKQKKALDGFDN